jgi:hypothetical protein
LNRGSFAPLTLWPAVAVEKREVINAFHHGSVGRDIYERLLADLDARILQVESGEMDEPAEKEVSQDPAGKI